VWLQKTGAGKKRRYGNRNPACKPERCPAIMAQFSRQTTTALLPQASIPARAPLPDETLRTLPQMPSSQWPCRGAMLP